MPSSVSQLDALARALRAMGHPTRLRLLKKIAEQDVCVSDLQRDLKRSQPNISQHLAILRDRGLVVPERRGNMTCYRLTDERIGSLVRLAEDVFNAKKA